MDCSGCLQIVFRITGAQFCKNTIGEIKEKLVIIDEYRGSRRNTKRGRMSVGKRIGEIVT